MAEEGNRLKSIEEDDPRKGPFLDRIRSGGLCSIAQARRYVGISGSILHVWLNNDPEFKEEYEKAVKIAKTLGEFGKRISRALCEKVFARMAEGVPPITAAAAEGSTWASINKHCDGDEALAYERDCAMNAFLSPVEEAHYEWLMEDPKSGKERQALLAHHAAGIYPVANPKLSVEGGSVEKITNNILVQVSGLQDHVNFAEIVNGSVRPSDLNLIDLIPDDNVRKDDDDARDKALKQP